MTMRGGDVKAMQTYSSSSEITLTDTDTGTDGSDNNGGCSDASHFGLQMDLTYATTKICKLESKVGKISVQRDDLAERCNEFKTRVLELSDQLSAAKAQSGNAASIASQPNDIELVEIRARLVRALEEKESAYTMQQAAQEEAYVTKQEIACMREELRTVRAVNVKLAAELHASSEVRTHRDKAAMDELHTKIETLSVKNKRLTINNAEMEKKHITALKQSNKDEEELETSRARIENMQSELKEVRKALASAETNRDWYVQL
jgi:chromosome segregation ATPase